MPDEYQLSEALQAQLDEQGGALPWISLSFAPGQTGLARALSNSGATSYVSYWTNLSGAAFNIQGSNGVLTTYANAGYIGEIKVGEASTALTSMQNGVARNCNGVEVTQTLTPDATGAYIKIQYTLRNVSNQTQQVSLCVHCDVQIGSLDAAPIERTDTGFKMWNSTQQFNVIAKNAYGVTDADTLWFGHYNARTSYLYNTIEESLALGYNLNYQKDAFGNITGITGIDSGMALSWRNRTIPAGEMRTYSFLLGVGATASAPIMDVGSDITVTYGQQMKVTALVSDIVGATDTLYYVLDMGTEDESSPAALGSIRANGQKLEISGNIVLPATWAPGELHKIYIWVMNQANAMSGIKEVPVYVKELETTGDNEMVEPKPKTLHFDRGGDDVLGTDPADQAVYVAEKTTLPESPYTRAGYTFGGWYDAENPSNRYPAYAQFVMPDRDATIKPYWISNETGTAAYYIEYYLQNLNDPTNYTKTQSISREGVIGSDAVLTDIDHLAFTGFTEAQTSGTVTSGTIVDSTVLPLRLKLYYNRNNYTLTFSEQYAPVTKPYGSVLKLTLPTAPDQSHEYVWNTAADGSGKDYASTYKLTDDATLYLILKTKSTTYTIRHLLQDLDGEGYSELYKESTFTTKRVGDFVDPQPLSDVPGFVSSSKDAGRNLVLDPSANVFSCFYDRKSYTITFDSAQATTPASPASATAKYQDHVTLPQEPTKTGYSFGGWFSAPNGAGSEFSASTPVTGSATVYAYWIANEITLPSVTRISGSYGTALTPVQLSAQNGTGSYTYAVVDGTLPAGVTLSSDGLVSGTPADVAVTPVRLTVQATDSGSGKQTTCYLDCMIGQRPLTVTNIKIKDKQYDGLADAEYDGSPVLSGLVSGDEVILHNGTPTFTGVTSAQNISVVFTAFSLSGADAQKYTLIQPQAVTASIVRSYTGSEDFACTKSDWSNTDFTVTANKGFLVSTADTDEGPWLPSIAAGDETANGTLTFYLRNAATKAISTAIVKPYKIDKTAPYDLEVQYNTLGWKQLLNTLTFGRFFKETVEVTAQASDDLSGIAAYQYLAADLPVTNFADANWHSSLTIAPNNKKYVYIRATDHAGNATICQEGTVVYTDSAPITTALSFTKASQEDLTAQVALGENAFHEIHNGTVLLTEGTDYTISGGDITFAARYLDTLSVGDYQLSISYLPMGESYQENADNQSPLQTTLTLHILPTLVTETDLSSLFDAPSKNGAVPDDFNTTQYGGVIHWTPAPDDLFLGGTAYTAVIDLAAAPNYTFDSLTSADFSYAGAETVSYDAAQQQLTIVFPATTPRQAQQVEMTGAAQKTIYVLGETFDPAGLTMTVTYDDGTTGLLTPATLGYRVSPAQMEADTTEVEIEYQGLRVSVDGLRVKENLTRILASSAITGLSNGTLKTEAALGLPQTVDLSTSKGTQTAQVVWDLAACSYDPARLTQQNFTIAGKIELPQGMTNVANVPLTTTIQVSVAAAAVVALPEKNADDPRDTDEHVVGITANQTVVPGRILSIFADSFVRGEYTYIPVAWATNPSGSFDPPTSGITYLATVDTSSMKLGTHTFTITYRQVKTASGLATGQTVQTQIDYQVSAPSAVTYTITTSAGAGGEFTTGQYVSVGQDETAGFGITPFDGYAIADVKVDGASVGAVNYYEFHHVIGDHTISATFRKLGAGPASSSSAGQAASSAGTEDNFWQQTATLISDAPNGSVVKVDAGSCLSMPAYVLRALFSKDVNLRVVRTGEEDLCIRRKFLA